MSEEIVVVVVHWTTCPSAERAVDVDVDVGVAVVLGGIAVVVAVPGGLQRVVVVVVPPPGVVIDVEVCVDVSGQVAMSEEVVVVLVGVSWPSAENGGVVVAGPANHRYNPVVFERGRVERAMG